MKFKQNPSLLLLAFVMLCFLILQTESAKESRKACRKTCASRYVILSESEDDDNNESKDTSSICSAPSEIATDDEDELQSEDSKNDESSGKYSLETDSIGKISDEDEYKSWQQTYDPLYINEKHFGQKESATQQHMLRDIRSEIAKIGRTKQYKEPELEKRIRDALRRDLNEFLRKNKTNVRRLPHGKHFIFEDSENELYGLMTSGLRREWTLLTPEGEEIKGEEIKGEVAIDPKEKEIVFKYLDQDSDNFNYTIIKPKTFTVIKNIQSLKSHIKLSPQDLQEFKRAAFFEVDDSEPVFKGYFEIIDDIKYDEETTQYRIKWKYALSSQHALKYESELCGDLDIGDKVAYDGSFGVVIDWKWESGQIKYALELLNNNETQTICVFGSDLLALWEKKAEEEDASTENETIDFSESFFERIAELLNEQNGSNFTETDIREMIGQHVSDNEQLYNKISLKTIWATNLTKDEKKRVKELLNEYERRTKELKSAYQRKVVLDFWKQQIKRNSRKADELCVAAARNIWKALKIEVLGSFKAETARFSISWSKGNRKPKTVNEPYQGLKRVKIAKDGNCFFNAIATGLKMGSVQLPSGIITADLFRKWIVNEVNHNRIRYQAYISENILMSNERNGNLSQDAILELWKARMKEDGEWADELCVRAARNILVNHDTGLTILSTDSNFDVLNLNPQDHQNQLILELTDNHYNLLIREEEQNEFEENESNNTGKRKRESKK